MRFPDLIKNGLKVSKSALFRLLLIKAGSFLANPIKLLETIEGTANKLMEAENTGRLKQEVIRPLKDTYRMIITSVKGHYRDFSKKNLVMSIATLFYFAMPIDLIPDPIPVIGFLDDISLFFWLLNIIQEEINRFVEWEELNTLFVDLDELDELFDWESEAPTDLNPPGESPDPKGKDV